MKQKILHLKKTKYAALRTGSHAWSSAGLTSHSIIIIIHIINSE